MWIIIPLTILLGMWGGQRYKAMRRIGIPLSAITMYTVGKKGKEWWKGLAFGLFFLFLSLGYGENSTLRNICKTDEATRIVYGLLLSIPFYIHSLTIGVGASILLPAAYSLRAGGFKLWNGYDFLYEDLIRFSTLGTLLWVCLGG